MYLIPTLTFVKRITSSNAMALQSLVILNLNIIWVSANGLWCVQLYDTMELSSNKNPCNKTGDKFADDDARAPDHRLLKKRQQAQRSWITWEHTQIMAVPTSTPISLLELNIGSLVIEFKGYYYNLPKHQVFMLFQTLPLCTLCFCREQSS